MIKLHQGDCLDILPSVGPIDAVITDPVWPNVPDDITNALRALLGIKSRTEFHDDPHLVMAFNRIKGNYEQWLMTR